MNETKKLKSLKILLVGHITESYGPMQALPKYLLGQTKEFAVISHPFPYCDIPCSKAEYFRRGKLIKSQFGPKYKFKNFFVIHYFGDIILTGYFLARLGKKWDIYIGCDCLNALTGILLRSAGVVKRVIFYENEYTVKRFRKETLNKIFHYLNGFAVRQADAVWDSPPNLEEMRASQGADFRKIIRVPHGVDLDKINLLSMGKINRYTLVFVGHLTETKGLQLVVEALGKVIKFFPQVKVAIVGSGPYEVELKRLVSENGLKKFFIFWGFTDHDWTLAYLPTCGVGLAPYPSLYKQALMHAEPLKVKDYLSCGLPVIITRFAPFSKEIEDKKLGVAINYKVKEMEKSIIKLLGDDRFYKICRRNIRLFSNNITWDFTYNQAFKKFFRLSNHKT